MIKAYPLALLLTAAASLPGCSHKTIAEAAATANSASGDLRADVDTATARINAETAKARATTGSDLDRASGGADDVADGAARATRKAGAALHAAGDRLTR